MRRKRRKLLETQGYRCFYCMCFLDFENATVDHLLPQSLGGGDNIENLAAACAPCNSRRGSRSVREMLRLTQPLALNDGVVLNATPRPLTFRPFDRVNEAFPLVVISVRDERYNRRSSVPHIVDYEPNRVVAPVDFEAGGTWMGVRPDGFFAALTNQEDGGHKDAAPSRGLVVREVLQSGMAWPIICRNSGDYNSYNLLHGRPGSLWQSSVYRGAVAMTQLQPGVHIVCNDEMGNMYDVKKERLRAFAQFFPRNWARPIEFLIFARYMTSDHHLSSIDPYFATCVHTADFGTRSVSVLLFPHDGTPLYYNAEGPACAGQPFEDYSELLR